MSDEMDLAQERVLAEQEQLQAQRLAQAMRVPVPNPAQRRVYCADCGERIDPRRVRALPGVERCVDCQGIVERSIR